MDAVWNIAGLILGIIGNILLVILFIVLAVLLLLTAICLSHPKLILKLKDNLEISVKLWFIKINITRLTSKPKKKKKPKLLHFDGNIPFGEPPYEKKKKKKKKSGKEALKNAHTAEAKKKEDEEEKPGIPQYIGLVTDILSDIKEPLKKVLAVDIKRLYATVSSEDPSDTAVLFGNMNTAFGMLVFACRKFAALKIDEENTGIYSDFTASKPSFDAHIELTLSVRHIVLCGIKGATAFLGFLKNK